MNARLIYHDSTQNHNLFCFFMIGASWNGHVEVARILLDNGANVNAKKNDGWIPLHCTYKNPSLSTKRKGSFHFTLPRLITISRFFS
jgi:Ankyrin repeats (many copies)